MNLPCPKNEDYTNQNIALYRGHRVIFPGSDTAPVVAKTFTNSSYSALVVYVCICAYSKNAGSFVEVICRLRTI